MFRSTTIIRELVLSLTKVMLEHLCPYRLCGGVAACLGSGVCVVCRAEREKEKKRKYFICRLHTSYQMYENLNIRD
jgi:hypothetical protein